MAEKLWAGLVLVMLLFLLVLSANVSVNVAGFDGVSGGFMEQSSVDWWFMFRHDLNHTGHSTSEAPKTNNTVWSYITGFYVFSSPVVVDGTVFVGSQDYNVYALNATDGALIWNYTTGGEVLSSPAVVDGKVFVGSQDYNVYALDASTGEQVWVYPTDAMVRSSPAVVDGIVFVGSYDCNIYALDASTGAKVWNYTTNSAVHSSPAVVDGKVFVGSRDRNVYALDASTGARIWNYTTGGEVWSSPAVADGMVFVGSHDGNVYALNASTGASVWKYKTGWYVFSSPAVASGMVFVGSYDYRVYAFSDVHDLAITGVKPNKNVAAEGFSVILAVNVTNQGGYTETFNVTAYANTTVVQTETITLASENYATVLLTWNTAGFAYGNYTIKAVADLVPGETDTADNTYINGIVSVTLPGDVDNSGEVNIFDIGLVVRALWTTPADGGTPGEWWAWNPDCDLDTNGVVDAFDLYTVTINYGKHA